MEQETGFLLINKPEGITSHDVVAKLRRISGIKKIGHAGTLDPLATGLLIVAIGRKATKQISDFVGLGKTYEAEFVLGATTETLDTESAIQPHKNQGPWTKEEISLAMKTLTGKILQIPPMYSAIKQNGKKLYELARKGKTVIREPRKLTIYTFLLTSDPYIENGLTILPVRISCTSGTYIRALARDLGENLKTSGYVRKLNRTDIGPYSVANSLQIADISQENWTEKLLHVNLES